MTSTRAAALILPLAVAAALGVTSRAATTPPSSPDAKLTAISARVNARSASLVVEATAPVPYVATRPDPLTVLLEFRNVVADNVTNSAKPDAKSPITAVSVEPVDALGVSGSRVRINLSQPVPYRVRSAKNTVVVDFDKISGKAAPAVAPPVTRQAAPAAAGPGLEMPAVDPLAALGITPVPESPIAATAPGQSAVRTVAANTTAAAAVTAASPNSAQNATQDRAQNLAAPLSQAQRIAQQPANAPAAQTASPQAATGADGVQRAGRQYTGTPVSLDFQQADLRAVLRVFSEISGLNIVIDPAVQGTVDVALRDVPWDQALDIILRANKLGYLLDGTIVRIAPLSVLADEETARRKLADEQALSGDLRVVTRTLSYAKAEELQPLLTKSALSQRGTVQVDARTNTLIISDLPDHLSTADSLISTLDRAQPQVEIEARIIQTSKSFARQLGVQWGFNGRIDPALGNTTNLAFPNNGSIQGRTGGVQGPTNQPTAVSLGVGAATSSVGLALGSVNGAFNLDVALSALESTGNGRVLSTPRVSTLNNVEAEMTQGIQIPLQTISNNTVTVTFKDAALTLKVTPQITAADTVIMRISLENATPDFSRAAGPAAIPPINTQRAITTLLVNDGQTSVIGGIYTSNQQNSTDRTPGLGQVPIINWLFKRDRIDDQSTELLIFITPKIIKG